ncbi:hypothetical protein EDC48_110111 [Gibbsiella quercinecans]|uniref:Uncharacterized protein n=1 Tax=Gibbsiella quercinecans TaxID=929813 RepID=A0A250B7J8_9GAMM|nr:hypothetical protein [Gibbsiella quercinecans]ATA22107.1 hypothetical protein AWC35_23775 [Gibbsiella quercinecans]RLM04532.1 hypothetical protein BIY30_20375 [Gibbsiella quercinecans]RLM09325.1 hypothetical protein BIY31_10175 [Gibbsiella quercinecans]TCT88000.1 hypothetical protein EDC48_110111 [Gibbsiella quercinecans]
MYYSEAIISKMASDKILAGKLADALSGVKEQVIEQASRIQDGATRMLYYMSCFTDNYQDVCSRLKSEDTRFFEAFYQLVKDRRVISELIHIYVELLLKNRTQQQLEYINRLLMKMSVNISTSSLTTQSFSLGVTMAICLGSNVSTGIVRKVGKVSGLSVAAIALYGYIPEAVESAERLRLMCPAYYQALYMRKLEMMYFLVEPTFMKARSFKVTPSSDEDIVNAIARMVR